MEKTFNFYCDESCHIENDHKRFMLLGLISCAYPQVARHTKRINDLKKEHNFYAEIKWNNVSKSKIHFYLDLVDFFFDTDLKYRVIGVDKSQIRCENYDALYYMLYYKLLNYRLNTLNHYNVYMDIKDTLSASKLSKLKEILNVKYGVVRNVQNIISTESVLMQLADFLTGAISYSLNYNEKINVAKVQIIEKIQRHIKLKLNADDPYFNDIYPFFINLE